MLEKNLKDILAEISAGNNLGEKITLVGASKTMPASEINKAISLGLEVVAENKVQEFREKTDKIIGGKQHFIGHLQTNKVKYLVGKVDLIQSVDSIRLAEAINDRAKKLNIIQEILIEINIGGELSKSGFKSQNAIECINQIQGLQNVKMVGLMAMLPNTENEEVIVSLTKEMRSLYEKCIMLGLPFKHLSVGMSKDYKLAIKNGSNMIRLGSVIFGKRNYEVK